MKPAWSAGIEKEFEQFNTVGILSGNMNVEESNSNVEFVNKDNKGTEDESNDISDLSHGKPINDIDNVN